MSGKENIEEKYGKFQILQAKRNYRQKEKLVEGLMINSQRCKDIRMKTEGIHNMLRQIALCCFKERHSLTKQEQNHE